jgi:predicted nucleic acid-binding protein
MLPMRKIIIADTSCFIVLNKIGELELLHQLYGEIITTNTIALEYGETLPNWVILKSIKNKYSQQLLEMQIDKGESSAIALALETSNCTVVLDDYKARKVAQRLGVNITGTIGIIIKAKLTGIIPSIIPILNKIKQTNFRLSSEIELQALIEAKESTQ